MQKKISYNRFFQLKEHLLLLGEHSGLINYMACVNMLRMVRILGQYRQASVLAMKLKFRERNPDNNNEAANSTLYEILCLMDYCPDSFDTPATREIRAQVPQ